MASIYVDTTVPSYYCETRSDVKVQARREITREWWAGAALKYELVTSTFVLEELRAGDYPGKQECLRPAAGLGLLPTPPRLGEIVQVYLANHLMPAEEAGDAAHLAMASLHKIDYLVTWNLKHLANVNKIRHIRVLNARLGIWTPEIVTPEFFFEEEVP